MDWMLIESGVVRSKWLLSAFNGWAVEKLKNYNLIGFLAPLFDLVRIRFRIVFEFSCAEAD